MSYLVIKAYSIACDYRNCDSVAPDVIPRGDERNPLRAARLEIVKEGWTYGNGIDLCPSHSGGRP
jgi:hypothetical protein